MEQQTPEDREIWTSTIKWSYTYAVFALLGALVSAWISTVDPKILVEFWMWSDNGEHPQIMFKIFTCVLILYAIGVIIMTYLVKRRYTQQPKKGNT